MSIESENSSEEGGSELASAAIPKNKMQSIFQQLEVMAMQKGNKNSLDLNKLDKGQIDKVLDTMAENEKNAFAFHSKRIDAIKEIELGRIAASVINQKTFKVVIIGAVLLVVPMITLSILFFKETFFIPWLTFLTGILGGFGISKITSNTVDSKNSKNPIKEAEEDEDL